MKEKTAVAALVYDFDKTLSPRDMQEYAFIPEIGLAPDRFWKMCSQEEQLHQMDSILAYMYVMLREARGRMLLTRDIFCSLGSSVTFFDGVTGWFDRINAYGEQLGITVEHYIISSGLQEIIEGTPIARYFKKIYAARFCYDERGVPIWPAMAVNYTSKTQFLFRINKGVLDVNEHNGLNEFMPEEQRRVPFGNMIYFGDGMTDIPCMRLVKASGGHSIALYGSDPSMANAMLEKGRVDFIAPADYRDGQKLDLTVKAILDKIKTADTLYRYHERDREQAGL